MTSQGSAHGRFTRAIKQRNLFGAVVRVFVDAAFGCSDGRRSWASERFSACLACERLAAGLASDSTGE